MTQPRVTFVNDRLELSQEMPRRYEGENVNGLQPSGPLVSAPTQRQARQAHHRETGTWNRPTPADREANQLARQQREQAEANVAFWTGQLTEEIARALRPATARQHLRREPRLTVEQRLMARAGLSA